VLILLTEHTVKGAASCLSKLLCNGVLTILDIIPDTLRG
jgi:hypothetical protein